MHEFGVAASVLEAVEGRAAGRPVATLRLHVGALQRLDRDVFDQAFALVGGGGVADGAHVDVVEVAVEVRCRGCGPPPVAEELLPRRRAGGALMCLGIPGELVEMATDETDLALVSVAGVRRRVNVGLLTEEEDL